MRVGLANGPGKSDGLVAQQCLFNLGRVDVVTTPNDQVLGTAGDPKVSVFVEPPQITRAQVLVKVVKIYVLIGLSIGVAGIDARVRDADFTDLIGAAFDRSIRPVLQDLHIRIGERNSD